MNKLSVTLAILLFAVLAFFGGNYVGEQVETRAEMENLEIGAANAPVNSTFNPDTDSYLNKAQDVCGTHVGTTTVGCLQPTINATSSYISYVAGAKQATYQIKITAATTSVNRLNFTVQGSNDYLCQTLAGNASSTTDVVQRNINWYDAMVYLDNRVHPTTFSNASSSLVMEWTNATANSAQTVDLTGINFQCLRAMLSTSSTEQYIGLTTR